jgi:hypothetical protein
VLELECEKGGERLTPPRRCSWKLNFPTLGRALSITLRTYTVSIETFGLVFWGCKPSQLPQLPVCVLARFENIIELSGAHLRTTVVTTKDDNIVSYHFVSVFNSRWLRSKIEVGCVISHAS